MKRSLKFEKKTPKSARKLRVAENKRTEYTKKLIKEKSPLEMDRDREKMQQHDQDNGRGPVVDTSP